jgi:flagellin
MRSHYSDLGRSVERLSSGLRVNKSADDAAGLSIRELMRAEVAGLHQGVRNANDAVSMIQTADGALAVIDEKLTRMKELAEQAATGTYNAEQRLMIDQEFRAMGAEINRIAAATDFNGIKLLDGSLSGAHDGAGLSTIGAAKVHFGTGNDAAEDYYYIAMGNATLYGLGLDVSGSLKALSDKLVNGGPDEMFTSGIISYAVIPAGAENVSVHMHDNGIDDSIQLFTRDGMHLTGVTIPSPQFRSWDFVSVYNGTDANSKVLTEGNGFLPGATYDATQLNGTGTDVTYTLGWAGNIFTYGGMQFGYSGDGRPSRPEEYLTIDKVTEDLVLLVVGNGEFRIGASWGSMPSSWGGGTGSAISIQTQELAQQALPKIDDAVVRKDQIRAHLGAMQNRLENTVSNLQIQAENLQAAESRISDVDVAIEMTEFVHTQVLADASLAILAQANSLPRLALSLIEDG